MASIPYPSNESVVINKALKRLVASLITEESFTGFTVTNDGRETVEVSFAGVIYMPKKQFMETIEEIKRG